MRPLIRTYLRTISRIRVICACASRANWAITYAHCRIRARLYGALSRNARVRAARKRGKRDNFATGVKTMINYIMKIIAPSNRSLCAPPTRTVLQARNIYRCSDVASARNTKRQPPVTQLCNSCTSSYLKFIVSTM